MRALWFILVALVAGLFAASLLIGPAGLAPVQALSALIRGDALAETLVMREIRLPRAILAALVGAALGLAGGGDAGVSAQPAG